MSTVVPVTPPPKSPASSRRRSSSTWPSLYEGTGIDKPDFIAVVDVDPSSSSYGQIVGRTEMPNVGDELHHFGWNACSSACHSQLQRDTLVVPGLRSSRIHLLDISDPRSPTDQERDRGRGDQGEARAERAAHGALHARRHHHDLDARRRRRQLAGRVCGARRARLHGRRALGARAQRDRVHVRLLVPAAPEHAGLERVGRAEHVPGRLQPGRRRRRQVRAQAALLGPRAARQDPDDRPRRRRLDPARDPLAARSRLRPGLRRRDAVEQHHPLPPRQRLVERRTR